MLSWHEHEEDRERHRQLMTRWQEIERYLPPGVKCKERLQHEQQNLQSVEQQLTARLHAFAENQNNQTRAPSQQSVLLTWAMGVTTFRVFRSSPPPHARFATCAAQRSCSSHIGCCLQSYIIPDSHLQVSPPRPDCALFCAHVSHDMVILTGTFS